MTRSRAWCRLVPAGLASLTPKAPAATQTADFRAGNFEAAEKLYAAAMSQDPGNDFRIAGLISHQFLLGICGDFGLLEDETGAATGGGRGEQGGWGAKVQA